MSCVPVKNQDCVDEDSFLALVLAEFPSLANEFAEDKGLFHLQMSAFSRVAQNAIEEKDFVTLQRCYKIVEDAMENTTPEVENAVYVSFLEHLDFDNSLYGAEARRLLPSRLSEMLVELELHFQKLFKAQQTRQAKESKTNF